MAVNLLCEMNYDAFELQYNQTQLDRIKTSLEQIRQAEASPGRVIPDENALVIGDGRRLGMAIMFLDICSFSARLLETEVEQHLMMKALNLFFTEMVRIAEDYGGTVEKNTGDGLMAYFEDNGGEPPTSGSKRAVSCGLTMFRAATNFVNPVLKVSNVQEIQFRIGIDHGNVTIAKLGAARRFNSIVAVGATANVASKMLRFAGPSEMIIGDTVKKHLPVSWHQYAQALNESSGWIYRTTGQPYPFYKYVGRWTA